MLAAVAVKGGESVSGTPDSRVPQNHQISLLKHGTPNMLLLKSFCLALHPPSISRIR
jgi:hypothetical protein